MQPESRWGQSHGKRVGRPGDPAHDLAAFYTESAKRSQLNDARRLGSPGKKNICKLIVSRSDALAAHTFAALFTEQVRDMKSDWALYVPLSEAAVVAYSRSFIDSRGSAGQLRKCWYEYADPTYRELHDTVVNLRHKQVAHSDATARRLKLIPAPIEITGGVIPKFDVELSGEVLSIDQVAMLANLSYALGYYLDVAVHRGLPQHYPEKTFGASFDPLDFV